MKRTFDALIATGLILLVGHAGHGNPIEANGFRGNVTGVVKSAQSSGLSFVLTVSEAKAAAEYAAKNDGSKLIGKTITLGVREIPAPLPKVKTPSPRRTTLPSSSPSRRACGSTLISSPW